MLALLPLHPPITGFVAIMQNMEKIDLGECRVNPGAGTFKRKRAEVKLVKLSLNLNPRKSC